MKPRSKCSYLRQLTHQHGSTASILRPPNRFLRRWQAVARAAGQPGTEVFASSHKNPLPTGSVMDVSQQMQRSNALSVTPALHGSQPRLQERLSPPPSMNSREVVVSDQPAPYPEPIDTTMPSESHVEPRSSVGVRALESRAIAPEVTNKSSNGPSQHNVGVLEEQTSSHEIKNGSSERTKSAESQTMISDHARAFEVRNMRADESRPVAPSRMGSGSGSGKEERIASDSVHIGTVEVRLLSPATSPPLARPRPAARPATSSTTLSRGFTSFFGLRQR